MSSEKTLSNSSTSGSSSTLPGYDIEMSYPNGNESYSHNRSGIVPESQHHNTSNSSPEIESRPHLSPILSCSSSHEESSDWLGRLMSNTNEFIRKHKWAFIVLCFLLYNAFFVFAISRSWNKV